MPDGNTYIGVEIGGSKLQAALGTGDGGILHIERAIAPADEGPEAILSWFDTSIPMLMEKAEPPRGIGIGFGGPVDSNNGDVLVSHQVEGWSGFPLGKWFAERFGLPVTVENDSNAAGWAEFCCGAGRGTKTFCYMNIGSGIGGALVIDGKLHNGQGIGASEIGHTWIPDFTADRAGAADKVENLCSGWAIEKRVRRAAIDGKSPLAEMCGGDAQRIDCGMIGLAAEAGDALAIQEIGRVAEGLACALGNVITLVHPERIAIGGGVSLMGDVLLNPLRECLKRYAFHLYRDSVAIVPCELGESVVVAGALLTANDRIG